MTTEAEQQILDAINSVRTDLQHQIAEVRTDLQHQIAEVRSDSQQQNDRFNELRIELREEVKRWDERFFQSTRDFRNLALTLIASTTIAVIVGMILLIIRS
jgi:flagellar motility protein MotE (MotC chaperone)